MVYRMLLSRKMRCNHRIYRIQFHFHQGYVVKYGAYFQKKLQAPFYHTKCIVLFLYIS